MKAYHLSLIPHPTYLEANKQTLEVCTDFVNWTKQEEEYIKVLATEAFFSKHVKVGYKILLQAPDKELQEVILK